MVFSLRQIFEAVRAETRQRAEREPEGGWRYIQLYSTQWQRGKPSQVHTPYRGARERGGGRSVAGARPEAGRCKFDIVTGGREALDPR